MWRAEKGMLHHHAGLHFSNESENTEFICQRWIHSFSNNGYQFAIIQKDVFEWWQIERINGTKSMYQLGKMTYRDEKQIMNGKLQYPHSIRVYYIYSFIIQKSNRWIQNGESNQHNEMFWNQTKQFIALMKTKTSGKYCNLHTLLE